MKKKLIWAFMIFCALGFVTFVLLALYGLAVFLDSIQFFDSDKWLGTKIVLGTFSAVFTLLVFTLLRKA